STSRSRLAPGWPGGLAPQAPARRRGRGSGRGRGFAVWSRPGRGAPEPRRKLLTNDRLALRRPRIANPPFPASKPGGASDLRRAVFAVAGRMVGSPRKGAQAAAPLLVVTVP